MLLRPRWAHEASVRCLKPRRRAADRAASKGTYYLVGTELGVRGAKQRHTCYQFGEHSSTCRCHHQGRPRAPRRGRPRAFGAALLAHAQQGVEQALKS